MHIQRNRALAAAAVLLWLSASCGGGDRAGGGITAPTPGGIDPAQGDNGTRLVLVSGGGQTGVAGQPLPAPVVVKVTDNTARPIAEATVNFLAKDGSASPTQAKTDADGLARTTWTLGTSPGSQELRVSGTGGTELVVSATSAPPPASVARVAVIPDSLVLDVGAAGAFTATAYDSAGTVLTGRPAAWSSSDSTVATVDASGGVHAVMPGSARITATVEGISASATVRVRAPAPAPVARVDVKPDSLVLEIGATGDFDAVAYDAAGNVLTGRAVTWTVSDSTIVALGIGGSVRALAAGTARVTATVEGISASATVRVRAPAPVPVARVDVKPDSLVLEIGATGDFDAVAYDAAGNVLTGRAVTWSTSDAKIVTLGTGGSVSGVAPGTAQVTATVEGISASAMVRVREPAPAPVARVDVKPDSLVLDIGATGDFDAVAYDAAGNVLTGRAVKWTVSDTTVATLGSGGSVRAVAAGTARVTATVEGVSATATVRVRAPEPTPVARVEVKPDSLGLPVGATGTVIAVAYDAAGNTLTGRVVSWYSFDAAIATVSAGTVRGVTAGCTKVRATVEGTNGFATVCVRAAPAVVARVVVRPDSLVLDLGATGDFDAVAYDSAGNVLTGRIVTWASSQIGVAPVGVSGDVTAKEVGTARVTATVEGVSGSATVRVRAADRPLITWLEMRTDRSLGPNGPYADASEGDRLLNFWVNTSRAVGSVPSIHIRGPRGTTASGRCDAENEYLKVTFRCPVYLPGGSEVGVWQVDQVVVDGTAYDYPALVAMNVPGRKFDVYGQGTDAAPPEVRTVVPTGWYQGRYWIEFGLVDHIVGVRSASLVISGPDGQRLSCPNANASYGVGARMGTWICGFTPPAGSGTWRVESITATDMNGNTATYTPADIEPLRGVFEYTFITLAFKP